MKIVFVGQEDAGGQMNAYSNAINNYTKYSSNCIVANNKFLYDNDIVVYKNKRLGKMRKENIENTLRKTKIIIVEGGKETLDWLRDEFGYVVNSTQRIFYFYSDISKVDKNYTFYYPSLTTQPIFKECSKSIFIPSIINNSNKRYCNEIKNDNKVILSHSTKNRSNKNTNAFLRIMSYLTMDCDIKYKLIENMTFNKSIEEKKKTNIGIDHIHEGFCYYGISSLENSAIGLVNIVSLNDSYINLIKDFLGCDSIPWKTPHDEGELFRIIYNYIHDTDLLYNDRLITYNWFHTYWNDNIVINKILERMGL